MGAGPRQNGHLMQIIFQFRALYSYLVNAIKASSHNAKHQQRKNEMETSRDMGDIHWVYIHIMAYNIVMG